MPRALRSSARNRSVPFTLTIMAWVTVGPAVAIGLLATGFFARFVLLVEPDQLLWTAVFGGAVMLVCAIPGQLAYRTMLRRRVLEPLGEIVSQVQCSSESVLDAATLLSGAASEISSSGTGISSAMQQIARGAELQSREVEETTSAMESMTKSVNSVALQAEETSKMSEEAARAAFLGEETTDQAIKKIAEIRKAIEALGSSVGVLGTRSKEIGAIVDVIASIADQTNLLSVNAAIEAARAGDLGRGFAVVAVEVQKLSERSAKAAEQISALVGDIQDETAVSVKRMEISTAEVTLGSEIVGKTGEALRRITEAVTHTSTLADEIASVMADQARDTDNVNRSMHDIAAVVEESAASVQETAAAVEEQVACTQEITSSAQELAGMAQKLKESALQFELD
ncbi:MAG: methyl-accepting chemotaxis protein [Actinomycetota bacterium]|nr:methyl-accepting chemotaxis protein [Actinomycetota bacterium]